MNSTVDPDDAFAAAHLTRVTGAPFVAIIVNWGLFGALSIQVYSYFQAFQNDKLALKALVYGVYLLEMTQTMLLTDTIWTIFGKGFGDLDALNVTGTTWLSIFLIGGLVGFLVQSFYVYRIFIISRNKTVARLMAFMTLCSLGGAVATAIKAEGTAKYSDVGKLIGPMSLWIGVGSSCDLAIVISMCYYLRKRIQNTPFRKTQALISRVILLTIETGALTGKFIFSSISMIALILFFSTPGFFEAPISIMAKVYSTTMLAVLNSRVKLGTMSAPATWLDNELTFPTSPETTETKGIKITMPSATQSVSSQNSGVLVAREVITISDPKVEMV